MLLFPEINSAILYCISRSGEIIVKRNTWTVFASRVTALDLLSAVVSSTYNPGMTFLDSVTTQCDRHQD